MQKISIVIPVYNSQNTIAEVVDRIDKLFITIKQYYTYEIILINDHSKDHSLEVCKNICMKNENVKLINFSKNFGQHNALIAGFKYVSGDYIVVSDDDLETSPEDIVALIDKIKEGNFDIVFSQYPSKQHSLFRNFGTYIHDKLATYLMEKPKDIVITSFFIVRSYIISEVIKYTEPYTHIAGIMFRITNNIGTITVCHNKRKYGKSNYTLTKLISHLIKGVINFSVKPLRLSSVIGFFISILSFIFLIVIIIKKLLVPETQLGWTSIMVIISFLGGVQLMSIGLVGEYVGRIFMCINKTPQYVIKNMYNIKNDK